MKKYLEVTHQIKPENRLQRQKRNARVMDSFQRLHLPPLLLPFLLLLLPTLLPHIPRPASRGGGGPAPSSPGWAAGGKSGLYGVGGSKRGSLTPPRPNDGSAILEVTRQRRQRRQRRERANSPLPGRKSSLLGETPVQHLEVLQSFRKALFRDRSNVYYVEMLSINIYWKNSGLISMSL